MHVIPCAFFIKGTKEGLYLGFRKFQLVVILEQLLGMKSSSLCVAG